MENKLRCLVVLLLCLTCCVQSSLAGFLPNYGGSFSVSYNHSSAPIDFKRFPDKTDVDHDDYEYFSSNFEIDGIFTGEIVIGAKNRLYHLNSNLTAISNFSWPISPSLEDTCINQGRNSRYVCQNHIRTYQRIPSSTNQLLVCGTQGNQIPQCRAVNVSDGSLGEGSAATDVPDGLVSYYVDSPGFGDFINEVEEGSDNRYFSAAFKTNNREFLLSYQNVNYNESNIPPLTVTQLFRTRETDDFWLRSPVMFVDYYHADYPSVTSVGDAEYYLVFLRENYQKSYNNEVIYSMMVRLCRNDPGSMNGNYFTSYLKTRIVCETEAPSNNRNINTNDFEYNVITSIAFNTEGRYQESGMYEKLMYGAFVVSSIGPVGSAVCVYRAGVGINGGIYQTYTQDTLDFSEDPPIPRENKKFLCNTAAPRDDNIAMFRVESAANVHQMSADPILVLNGYKITQMIVDSKCIVMASNTALCVNQDVLLLGTSVGNILKVIFATTGSRFTEPVIAEKITLDNTNSIRKMKLQMVESHQVIFATTDSKVYRISLDRCSRHNNSCSSCIWSRDPYCMWNTDSQRCELNTLMANGGNQGVVPSNYKQNIHTQENYPVVRFTLTSYTVRESEGQLTMTVESSRVMVESITMQVIFKDGTAIAGQDYFAAIGDITIVAGETNTTFNLTIIGDSILEIENETLTVGLQGTGTVCVVPAADVPIVIIDSDVANLDFSSASYMTSEGSSSVQVTITNSIRLSEVAVNVYLNTINTGSARAPNDFSAVTLQLLTFQAGIVSDINFSIPIVDDDTVEEDETFTVMLALASNEGHLGDKVALGASSQAVVTIMDNDMVTLDLTSANYITSEGSSFAQVTITNSIRLSEVAVNVYLNTINTGSARAPSDFSAVTLQLLTFQAGIVSDIHFSIPIVDDDTVEEDETFTVMLALASNDDRLGNRVALGAISQAVVTIKDNDLVILDLLSANYMTSEGSSSVQITITNSLRLSEVVVNVYLNTLYTGSARAPNDFSAVTSQLLTFPAGIINDINFSIPIVDDDTVEADETFTVMLALASNNSNVEDRVAIGAISQAVVTIMDNDMVTLDLSSDNYMTSEGSSSVQVTITNSINFSELAVNVYLNTINSGSAKAPNDFSAVTSQLLTFCAGSVSDINFSIPIVDDDIVEANETFTVMLALDSSDDRLGNRVALGAINQSVVTIMDNDMLELVVEIAGLNNKSLSLFGSQASGIIVLVVLLLIIAIFAVTIIVLALYVRKIKSKTCKYNVGSGHDTIPQTLDISAKYTNTGSLDTQASIQEKISISG